MTKQEQPQEQPSSDDTAQPEISKAALKAYIPEPEAEEGGTDGKD